MSIDYDHRANRHTLEGAKVAFTKLFSDKTPHSLLDVGCGTGTWLRAAIDFGVADVFGIDGVEIPDDQLLIPHEELVCHDLTIPSSLTPDTSRLHAESEGLRAEQGNSPPMQ
jgi:SAM-dependent methyltransferase